MLRVLARVVKRINDALRDLGIVELPHIDPNCTHTHKCNCRRAVVMVVRLPGMLSPPYLPGNGPIYLLDSDTCIDVFVTGLPMSAMLRALPLVDWDIPIQLYIAQVRLEEINKHADTQVRANLAMANRLWRKRGGMGLHFGR